LLQIRPNGFLGNCTPDPRLKWALIISCQRKELSCKGYAASVAHPWALAVYHQFSLKSLEIPYVSMLYNQLKTYHLARIPFNLGAKGCTASVAHPWALAFYHQFSLKSLEIPYISMLYNQLKSYHLAVIAKAHRASVAHPWALAVYHQFSLKSLETPYVSVLYNQLKTNYRALIPFNLGATCEKR